jgi:diguanylate cyclase (GGDEF)-like protein
MAWLACVAATAVLVVASAMPHASAPLQAIETVGQVVATPAPIPVNPRNLAGTGALVVSGLLFLLFFYRRRLYILCWIVGWVLAATSMFIGGRTYDAPGVTRLAYGVSQYIGILSALVFVVSADAYPTTPRLPRGYVYVLLPLFLWFALAPVGLGDLWPVYAPGHILIAGALAAAGIAHVGLLRHARMLGAIVVGVSFVVLAGSNVWLVAQAPVPAAPPAPNGWLTLTLYLVAALGMQLMTFEDMTWELRRTNRRLETAQGKLRRMVITDALTGCRNRRFFDEIIGREMQRHHRYGIPMSVLFVDIDRFKAINDTLGHDAGDRVLKQVAAFLLHNIREADYVFRWGGDEFLILLSCSEQEAERRGAALQAAFARSPEAAALPAGVGLSIGTAEIMEEAEDVMARIRLADERMYENKRSMRKRG